MEKKKIKLLPTYDNPLPHSNLKPHLSNESLSPTGTMKVQPVRQKLNIEGIDSLNMSWDSGSAPGNKDQAAKSSNAMVVTQHAKLTKMVNQTKALVQGARTGFSPIRQKNGSEILQLQIID